MYPTKVRGVKRIAMMDEDEEMEMFMDMPPRTRMAYNLSKGIVYYIDPSMYDNVTWVRGRSRDWTVYEKN